MMTIWKFPLPDVKDVQELELPATCHILGGMQVQAGIPTFWAIVNTDAPKVKVNIHVRGTGHELNLPPPPLAVHIGTVQLGPLVWHYFLEQQRSNIVRPH